MIKEIDGDIVEAVIEAVFSGEFHKKKMVTEVGITLAETVIRFYEVVPNATDEQLGEVIFKILDYEMAEENT